MQGCPDIGQWAVDRADQQKIDDFIARICENEGVAIEK
jgi:hypothetical protein